MTTDSDSECSYVGNLADFNVMRVIIIVIVIKIVYNRKKSSNSYSNNGNKIVYNSKKSNNSDSNNCKKCNNTNYSNYIIIVI